MVRAPCCEKMGLKKGPWTAEEDRTLINFVNDFGHGNWRALPKQAGLLRCGKSCRLRWVNYLDPSIKRGNFSREEEENIIKLHEMLGNRWSAIAARLPGRTDNEIKNVWHTHLKKRVDKSKNTQEQPNKPHKNKNQLVLPKKEQEPASPPSQLSAQSPQHSGGSEISSFTTTTTTTTTTSTSGSSGGGDHHDNMVLDGFPEMDEGFWSDVFSGENSGDFVAAGVDPLAEFQYSSLEQVGNVFGHNSSTHDINMDFWLNVFTSDGALPEF